MILTSLVYCENGYTIKFNLTDFNADELNKCTVNTNTGCIESVLYNDNFTCYDLYTVLDKKQMQNVKRLNAANLVVVKGTGGTNNSTYEINIADTVDIPDSIRNIIIPYGITVYHNVTKKENANKKFCINGKSTINLIVLGTITNCANAQALFDFNKQANIIIGPQAIINCNNAAMFWFGEDPNSISNLVLYPGCQIKMLDKGNFIVGKTGTVFLNKYTKNDSICPKGKTLSNCDKIYGTIPQEMKIVFHTNVVFNDSTTLSPFYNLSWSDSGTEHEEDETMTSNGTYSKADVGNHFSGYDKEL